MIRIFIYYPTKKGKFLLLTTERHDRIKGEIVQ